MNKLVLLMISLMLFCSCGAKHEQSVNTNAQASSLKHSALNLNEQLHAAMIADDPSRVAELLQQGADTNNTLGEEGDFYLHEAVAAGSIEIVALLIEFGADPYQKNREGKSAFDWNNGEIEEMETILSGGIITRETHDKLFLSAVKNNRIRRARYNLEKGANPNVVDERKSSVLMLAVNEKNIEMVDLLAKWPGINLQYKVRKTALGMAKDILLKDRRAGQETKAIQSIIDLLESLGAI